MNNTLVGLGTPYYDQKEEWRIRREEVLKNIKKLRESWGLRARDKWKSRRREEQRVINELKEK